MIANYNDAYKLRLYKSGILNLEEYYNLDVSEYYKSKNKKTPKIIDLSQFPKEIKRTLIDFINEALNSKDKTLQTIHATYIIPLIDILPEIKASGSTSMLEYFEVNALEEHKDLTFIKKLYNFTLKNEEHPYIINLENHKDIKISSFYKGKNNNILRIIDIRQYKSEELKEEIYAYIDYVFNQYDVSIPMAHTMYITSMIELLSVVRDKKIKTLLDIDINELPQKFTRTSTHKAFINVLIKFLGRFYDKSNGFDLDEWDLNNFNLSKERLNESRFRTSIKFDRIKFDTNKILVKKYIWHLLVNTDMAVSTIDTTLSRLTVVLNYFKNKPLDQITRDDVIIFYEWLDEKYSKDNTYNEFIYKSISLFEYLELQDYIDRTPFNIQDTKKNIVYEYKETSIDKYVINQIFNILDKVETELSLMFLTIYCTGMRISEVCQIKRNCLQRTNSGFFILFYSQKMKKDVTNVIPESLYKLLDSYRKSIPKNQENLFISANGTAFQATTLSEKLKEVFMEFDIKNPDGSNYVFRAHDYRHTMGAKMMDRNIPFQFIQEQLHHESPEMTVSYIEYTNKKKIRKMNEFIDIKGEDAPIKVDIKLSDDEAYAEYMRSYINAQMLPNGVCAKPVKLGKCPHANSCLNCSEFRTSLADLSTHKAQLSKIDEYIKIAEENGWVMQVESNKITKQNLEKIIAKLESIESEDK
ncbi:tyrosine-type recombinase/integrase [Clostridium perfringens]|uniref:tyrosine-type recombinase/integrase n=1 Tax=Clostridium perfringens TaxID=1502 RepID=UPI0018E4AE9A|nr:tyrosine-type recombinase/integrase [Clostridium perfringens]MBI6001205.1 site-specific integrase [Clostridium perfringens]